MNESQTQGKRAPGATMEDVVGQFHAHLDECETCREHPFDLCPIGHRLLTTPRIPVIQPGPLAHLLPNAEAHGRRSRTAQPLVGSLEVGHAND